MEFQPGRIAGIRLAGAVRAAEPKAAVSAATIELRSGERLRGRLLALDENHLQLEHSLEMLNGLERSMN